MTRVVQTLFALTRLRPEGKCPDTTASRRKVPLHTPSGKQMPWRAASGCTVPWRTASGLSRLRPKRPERLVRPDAQDAIFFFLMLAAIHDSEIDQMDVVTAFLNPEVDGDVYMAMPDGVAAPAGGPWVSKLCKSLYGLKQAPRLW